MWAGSSVDKAAMPRRELELLIQHQKRELQRQQHRLEAQQHQLQRQQHRLEAQQHRLEAQQHRLEALQEENLKLRAELQSAKKRKREGPDAATAATERLAASQWMSKNGIWASASAE